MSTPEHDHVFRPASLRYNDGTPIPGGRRCACGVEVVGDGPFALSAELCRASRGLTLAMGRAMADLGERIAAERRRTFPPC